MREALDSIARELGRTPTIDTHLVVGGDVREIGLKLEGANPTGSLKARTAHSLLRDLYDAGRLRPDSVVVESTSGNLGVWASMGWQQPHTGIVSLLEHSLNNH